MKLKYTKPDFVVERFDLAQSIAANCSAENQANPGSSIGDPNWGNRNECGWRVGQYVLWIDADHGCNLPTDPNAEIFGVCYNNPSGNNVIFNS